ncbi:MAG: glycine zipper domain-containing protein [Verrucomicrobia bacterium]|nr:glycine zipper domain-containing protein [Verrucomicrobiota bacterium]
MRNLPIAVIAGTALVTMSFSGCETPTGQGAGFGAATGAILGGIAGNNVRGAAIGAGAGALAGAVIGHLAAEDRRAGYVGYEYRVASPSRHYGYVVSPYRPFALVDVRGIRSGARVMDPVSERVFINP